MKATRLVSVLGAVLLLVAAVAVPVARADTITLSLTVPNAALVGYPAPYASVQITVPGGGGAATFAVTGLLTGGYQYLLGGQGAFGFNSSLPVTVGSFSWAGGNGNTAFSSMGSQNEDGFGLFNNTIDNFDGFNSAVTWLQFIATPTGGGSFANAASVLVVNGAGSKAVAHIFAAGSNCNGACVTGYAADGGNPTDVVPEPASLLLLGTGLFGLGRAWRKRRS